MNVFSHQAGGTTIPALAGHSASLSNSIMTVIGGYNTIRGFNHKVYQYNILRSEWSSMDTESVVPPPAGIVLAHFD